MDISTKTTEELKALAYDLIVKKEQAVRDLEIVNNLIGQRLQAPEPSAKKKEK